MRALLLLIIYFHILKIYDALEDFNGHKSVLPSNAVIPEIVPPFSSNIVNGNNGIVGQSIYPNSPCQTSCNSQSTQCPSYCSQAPQLCTSGCQQQTSTKTVTVQVPVRVSKTVAENITRTVQKQPRRVKVEMETEIIKECPKNYRMIEDENDNQRCEADRTALISCPVDYEFKNNKCVRTVVTCPNEHNKIRQNCALRIVCPQSYHQQGDECVPPIPQCPYGWNWNGKICEPERLSCPTGYTLGNNNQCIHEMHRCPPYHREFGNQCIMEEPGCNYGFNINTNSHTCEKVVNKCPKGSHEQYGECINLSYECPTGSVDAGNHCTFDQTVQKLVYEIKYVPQTMTLPGPVTSNCNSYVNYGGYANYGCASPCIWFGHRLLLLNENPEDVCKILNSPHCNKRPPFFYDAYIVRDGLVLSNDEIWERHRKVLNHSFSSTNLHQFVSIFSEKSKIYCKKLEDKVGKGEFNIYDFSAGCALETLMKSTLNYDNDFYESKYFEELERLKVLLMKRMFQPWLSNPILFKMTKLSTEINRFFKSTLDLAEKVISANQHLKTFNQFKNHNVISQLMNSRNNFNYNEIRDEIVTFIVAGHETTALTLSSVILMLAIHKDIQQKVIDEIEEILVSTNESIDVRTLQKLTYLDYVIKEAMRLYPVVPIFARESTDEFLMNGHIIPKGVMFVSSIFNLHRNPKHWGNDAHLFKPERFEDESIKNVHPYAFIPFTGGKRICIGWKYTMLFKKAFLIEFLRNFEIDTTLKFDDLNVIMTPTVVIEQGYLIKIQKRRT